MKQPVIPDLPGRAHGLDAMRGFAILMMVLSGIIPFGVLPAWMYHAQVPPPDHVFDPGIAGITWVDLVFPLFLFSMGVAIPLALNRRLERGTRLSEVCTTIAVRGLMLFFFALFLQHMRPAVLQPADPESWPYLAGIAGFGLLFLIYTRPPAMWSRNLVRGLRIAGFAGAIAMLVFLRYPDGSGFSLYRSDIILVVLANMAVFASLIWLATQHRPLMRLGLLAFLAALMLAANEEGWVSAFWNESPVPWIFRFDYLKYLFILLPATVAGDLLHDAMKKGYPETLRENNRQSHRKLMFVSLAGAALLFVVLTGLFTRHVFAAFTVSIVIMGSGLWLLRHTSDETERLFRILLLHGTFWLLLGFFAEPFEGGIRKDHATFSYYFVTTGLSIWILVPLMIWIDVLGGHRRLSLLIQNGQNPMIAYAGMQNAILPVLTLTGLHDMLVGLTAFNPWFGVARALLYTLLLAIMVRFFTRKKIFWRS